MVLKRLEAFGFKSFAERTVVEFPTGITAIVGPNGCGKSNVSDAIRWVLGEQSAKSLRGSKMEDVIFSGTTRRPALGFSEVTLTFDNSKKLFPLEFSEVSIGRRLFRSGESSYTVNKKECRLRDVYDLLMDSGIGRRAHAIIEQGKIDEIVTAKPEERRVIIEEAAGIAKYRSRRAEALRRLKSAEDGLRRVDDLIAELERQQATLRRSAKKAERFREIEAELKALEIRAARAKGSAIDLDLKGISRAYEKLQSEIVEAEAASATISAAISREEHEIASLREELRERGREVSEAERESSSAEARLEETITRYNDDGRTIENFSEEIARLEKRIAEELAEMAAAEKDAAECDERLSLASALRAEGMSRLSGRSEILEKLLASEKSVSGRYSDVSQGLVRRESERAHTLSMSEKSEQLRRAAIARRSQLLGERELLEQTIRGIEIELLTLDSELGRVLEEKLRLSRSADELARQLSAGRDDLNIRERELAVMRNRFETASANATEHIGELERVAAEIGLGAEVSLALVDSSAIVPADYAAAFSAALGDVVYGVLVSGAGDLDANIALVSERMKGRVIMPADPLGRDSSPCRLLSGATELRSLLLPGTPGAIRSLLAGWYLVDTADDARELRETLAENERIVTRTGDIYYSFGAMRVAGGAESDELASGRENLRGRIAVLGAEIEELRLELAAKDEMRFTVIAELRGIAKRAANHETRSGELRSRVGTLKEKLAADVLGELEASIQISHEECSKAEERALELSLEIAALGEERVRLEAAMAGAADDVAIARRALDDSRSEVARIESEANLLHDRAVSRKRAMQSILRRLEESKLTEERYATMIRDLGARRTESSALIEMFRRKTGELCVILEEKRGAFRRIEAALEDRVVRLSASQDGLKQVARRREESSTSIHDLDMRKVELSGEWRHLVERIREKYGVDMAEEAGPAQMVMPEDAERLEELRSILSRLGAVNFAAAEELGEVDNRLEFYHRQRRDLAQAESDLGQVVREIDEKTVSLFNETFNAVNTNFGLLFKRLFSSTSELQGSAELVLLNPENPLESGIDIVAMPPGKKPQSITLLSGGEKAMTAISLLFAVFLVRPSPFAILDELDAPLDEANVERFARILREFSLRSQFIVVTHNKRTMEVANTLYGVAMPERGVSNIFGVRLSEATELSEAAG